MRRPIIVGVIAGAFILALLLASDAQLIPFYEWRYHSPVLTFVFALLNLPVIIAMALTGLGHEKGPAMALFFIWWFIMGFCLAWFWGLFRLHRNK
jgi:hypothetical protein